MDDILFGKRKIKDGAEIFVTEKDVWILKQSRDENQKESGEVVKDQKPEPSALYKSKVCWDCDYAQFIHSECEWYCTLTRSFTRGYCEVSD